MPKKVEDILPVLAEETVVQIMGYYAGEPVVFWEGTPDTLTDFDDCYIELITVTKEGQLEIWVV